MRTLREEPLDHILPLSEHHVRSVLAEFVAYYNQDRPHRSLGLETPVPRRRPVDGGSLDLSSEVYTTSTSEPPNPKALTLLAIADHRCPANGSAARLSADPKLIEVIFTAIRLRICNGTGSRPPSAAVLRRRHRPSPPGFPRPALNNLARDAIIAAAAKDKQLGDDVCAKAGRGRAHRPRHLTVGAGAS